MRVPDCLGMGVKKRCKIYWPELIGSAGALKGMGLAGVYSRLRRRYIPQSKRTQYFWWSRSVLCSHLFRHFPKSKRACLTMLEDAEKLFNENILFWWTYSEANWHVENLLASWDIIFTWKLTCRCIYQNLDVFTRPSELTIWG